MTAKEVNDMIDVFALPLIKVFDFDKILVGHSNGFRALVMIYDDCKIRLCLRDKKYCLTKYVNPNDGRSLKHIHAQHLINPHNLLNRAFWLKVIQDANV